MLLFPAALFMAALVLRNLHPLQNSAQQLVMWYAGRMWTLWVLLLALPFTVLITGAATLLHTWNQGAPVRRTAREWFAVIRDNSPAMRFVAATTLGAGVVLAIVIAHMAAN